MKTIRMAALSIRRKTKAIKRRRGKSRKLNPASMPTIIKNIRPVKNALIELLLWSQSLAAYL